MGSNILSYLLGYVFGLLSAAVFIFIKSKINFGKLRMRKYKNKLYTTILQNIREMPTANMNLEDFKDNVIQNSAYGLIIEFNINNIDYIDIYEYILNFFESYKGTLLEDTLKTRYSSLQEEEYKKRYADDSVGELEESVNTPQKFPKTQIPDEYYRHDDINLTNPFRMGSGEDDL